ncbi:hypothetical protein N7528_001066 [Penicillium herquei]|nr:hypothetical protein N7528_001066 [Penicillium herquei]
MKGQMEFDDVAWEQAEYVSDKWLRSFLSREVRRPIAEFMLRHDSGPNPEFRLLEKGSFNITAQMRYTGRATNIRFSRRGAIMFPEEKVKNEAAVMRYLQVNQESIPVPFVVHAGTIEECPLNLSPFIMMSHIEHSMLIYDALNRPGCPKNERGILYPDIAEDRLETLYTELAKVLLQLYRPNFPKIGSLTQVDDFSWEVTRRPLSMNMNELVRLETLPRSELPPLDTTFNTTSSYIETLAHLNIRHLYYQRNDAIQSADDCRRRKYVGRQLFYKLAKDKRFFSSDDDNGPFKLWCDDLRPANILIDNELHITGVIDWEFTYTAPVEFSHAPPWWLLIEKPDYWSNGFDDWTRVFDYRLKTFLEAMRRCEDTEIQDGQRRLSDQMQQSWESGDFWVVYAILNSFVFDAIYWQKIDQRFFGPTETKDPSEAWRERLHLLDELQRDEMEQLVTRKLEEMKDRVLAWDPDEYTSAYGQELKRREEEEGAPESQAG